MRTIYVFLAEKQYSSSKVIAAFDTQEGADKMKELIEAVEPRWTLSVQPIELHVAPPKPVMLKTGPEPIGRPVGQPTATWVGSKDDNAVGWDRRSARLYEDGGPLVGVLNAKPHAADPPLAFIPENPDGPGAA